MMKPSNDEKVALLARARTQTRVGINGTRRLSAVAI